MKTLFLHIGTHKTGSSSIQRWLLENESLLNKNATGIMKMRPGKLNNTDLYMASMRYERDALGKRAQKNFIFDEKYTAAVKQFVQDFIKKNNAFEKLVFTTEGLSLLRHNDELKKLKKIISHKGFEIKIILYLRNKKKYLDSYKKQILKFPGREFSSDYSSALYVEDDTWLIDYKALTNIYARTFGQNNLTVINYDKEMEQHKNIIPSFAKAIQLDLNDSQAQQTFSYFDNISSS